VPYAGGPTAGCIPHNVFEASKEHLVYTDRLAFRSPRQTESDLESAGLEVVDVWGSWLEESVTVISRLLVFEAVRPPNFGR
jgi:hypothetical protein